MADERAETRGSDRGLGVEIPREKVNVEPSGPKTLMAMRRDRGEMPRVRPAMVPTTWVPWPSWSTGVELLLGAKLAPKVARGVSGG